MAAFRLLGTLRDRGLVQAVVLPGPAATGGTTRAHVLTAAGQRVYAADDDSYPRRIRQPTTLLLDHAVTLAEIVALPVSDGRAILTRPQQAR